MTTRALALLACAAATTGLVAAASPASAAGTTTSVLVVNTQFWDAPSPVMSASGLFSGCTAVTTTKQAPARALQFNGRKLVECAGGTMEIAYQAAFRDGTATGTWTAAGGTGTLAGVRGTGTVLGTGDCTLIADSGGCVLDTWTGELFLAPA